MLLDVIRRRAPYEKEEQQHGEEPERGASSRTLGAHPIRMLRELTHATLWIDLRTTATGMRNNAGAQVQADPTRELT